MKRYINMLHSTYIRVIALITLFSISDVGLHGERSIVEPYSKRETQLSGKTFEQKKWSGGIKSNLMEQKFPFKHWNKHYSSLGSKKWNTSLNESKEKKKYKTNLLEFKKRDMQVSKWQNRIARLESQAQISTDSKARIIQDKRVYEMILQQADHYSETGNTVSLRDINRFQFRRNRPDDKVPVSKAGSNEES